MGVQDEMDNKVRDIWRRLNLDTLADVDDVPGKPKNPKRFSVRKELDDEVVAAYIQENYKK